MRGMRHSRHGPAGPWWPFVLKEGAYGGTWFHSPLRCAQWGSKKEYRNCRQFRYFWYGVRDSTCAAAQATSG